MLIWTKSQLNNIDCQKNITIKRSRQSLWNILRSSFCTVWEICIHYWYNQIAQMHEKTQHWHSPCSEESTRGMADKCGNPPWQEYLGYIHQTHKEKNINEKDTRRLWEGNRKASKWLLKFHSDKCKLLTIVTSLRTSNFQCTMYTDDLATVPLCHVET